MDRSGVVNSDHVRYRENQCAKSYGFKAGPSTKHIDLHQIDRPHFQISYLCWNSTSLNNRSPKPRTVVWCVSLFVVYRVSFSLLVRNFLVATKLSPVNAPLGCLKASVFAASNSGTGDTDQTIQKFSVPSGPAKVFQLVWNSWLGPNVAKPPFVRGVGY